MTFRSIALPYMLVLAGCPMTIPNEDGGGSSSDGSCHVVMPDLAPSPAKCAAAKGLTGENVVCVDFPTKGSLTELTGWNFKAAGASDCWILAVGQQTGKKVLLVNSFSTYSGECALTTPQIDLSLPERKDYSRLTLSLLERTDVNPATANNGLNSHKCS